MAAKVDLKTVMLYVGLGGVLAFIHAGLAQRIIGDTQFFAVTVLLFAVVLMIGRYLK